MLDKTQEEKSQKKTGLLNGFFGNKKKTKKLNSGSKIIKKLEAPKQIGQENLQINKQLKASVQSDVSNKFSELENNISKINEIGIGESEFQPKKDVEQKGKKQEKIIGEENFNQKKESRNSIEQDYQRDVKYSYQESEYIKESPEKVLIKWRGPDYEIYPKSKRWYTIAGFILAGLVAYAVFKDSPLTAIVFILIGIVGYMYLERDPQLTDFAVSYDGIIVGNEVYDWDDIVSFWIFYDPPHTRVISLHMKGKLMPYIHIPLHQIDPVEVREKMMEFIPEIKQEQGMVDILERLLHM